MKSYTIVLCFAVLAVFFVRSSDAVACSDTILTNCTDCTDGANVDNADCTTTTTTTTQVSVTLRPNRQIVRVQNLQYTNVRRIRVNRNGNGGGTGTNTGTGTRYNRGARRNRGNNIRVFRG
ncbi:uncharacterized protein LOC117792897 [Drosophila innubila]|uniref:uncharacterized protein LOC117792897 n=1 Tax=Drosophila innubila TaxID=198719 RepID=UPI00148C292B|nr:uncharacterized protein LOC117792897 [Drosophila innubila]